MTYRKNTSAAILLVLMLAGFATVTRAGLSGNTFTSETHRVSLTRPDGSWELRENPAQENAVMLYANGEGRVIAMLLHKTIESRDVITDKADLTERWPEISSEIISLSADVSSGPTILFSEYKTDPEKAVFDIVFSSTSPRTREPLRNWVSGMIVRDENDRQHIYLVRCAAPEKSFAVWESQFDRLAQSLHYTGSVSTPLYTSPPKPWWLWVVGAAVLLLVVLVIRQRSGSGRQRAAVARRFDDTTGAMPAPSAFSGAQAGAMTSMPPPSPHDGPEPADLSNVPDQVFYQGETTDTPPSVDGGTPNLAAESSFWKCRCGRMNPNGDDFCARCNTDRVVVEK